jgi:DNA modification methylase
MERPAFSLEQPGGFYSPDLAKGQLTSLDQLASSGEVLKRLAEINWDFVSQQTDYLSHDLHPYPAKFIPQIPGNLIAQLSMPGELVWDPFGGSGTTALEALLLDRRAISSDANPLATIIGRAKTGTLTLTEQTALRALATELALLSRDSTSRDSLIKQMRGYWERYVPQIANVEKWFADTSVQELAYLRHVEQGVSTESQRDLFLVALSRTVQKISFQDSETRYSSKPRDVAAGETLALFARELTVCLETVAELGHIIGFRTAKFVTSNAMAPLGDGHTGAPGSAEGSVDLIVTSPPYPNVTDYHLYHRFRMFWLGFNPVQFGAVEIGSHLRHQREKSSFGHYLEEMAKCLSNMALALRPGRYAVLVLGDGVFHGKTYQTATEVGKEAAKLGLEFVGTVGRAIHATRRSFAAPARRAREEQLLVLRKPKRNLRFTLKPPNYKLHKYETVLRQVEAEALLGKAELQNGQTLVVSGTFASTAPLRRLVFTHEFTAKGIAAEKTWQALTENGQHEPKKRKESNYWLHGVHPYKGKFYPQLAASLINGSGSVDGSSFLDPFCGSGTSVVEAMLRGHVSNGCDLNPLAVKIARVKTSLPGISATLFDNVATQISSRVEKLPLNEDLREAWLSGYSTGARQELESWFPRPVLLKLAALFKEIRQVSNTHIQEFLEVVLSGLVREISQQEPSDLRIRRRETPLKDADVYGLFALQLQSQYKKVMRHFRIRNAAPARPREANVWVGDCRTANCYADRVQKGSVDLVVTSPPYATALPYIDTYRLSHLLLFGAASSDRRPLEFDLTGSREIKPAARTKQDELIEKEQFGRISSPTARRLIREVYRNNVSADVGFRRKNQGALLYRYFDDMSASLENLAHVVRRKGQVILVIGNNFTEAGSKRIVIDSVTALRESAEASGFTLHRQIPITVTTENLRHQKNAITENSILWLVRR